MVKYIWIAIVFWGLCAGNAQIADTRGVDFYRELGSHPALSFLKDVDLGNEIYRAISEENARALGGYAAILFYAQRVSGTQSARVSGMALLDTATKIAMKNNDAKTLRFLAQEWQDPYFGAGDKEKAKSLLGLIGNPQSRRIELTPEWKELSPGGKIIFHVTYKDTGEEVAVKDLSFEAQRGRCLGNLYFAPKSRCNDIVWVRHTSGQTAQAVIVVKGENHTPLPKLTISPWMPDRERATVDPYQALDLYDAQEILLKEEEARIAAKNNVAREIERILSFVAMYDDAFKEVRERFSVCRGVILAGVKTGKPYMYQGEDEVIRVVVSASAKSVIDSLRKNCQQNGVKFSKSMKKRILKIIPKTIKAEGTASLE